MRLDEVISAELETFLGHVSSRVAWSNRAGEKRYPGAPVTERVQVLRRGAQRTYVVAAEHEDGSLLLAPEPAPSAQEAVPAEDARAPVAVPGVAGILQVRDLTVAYGPKMAVDAGSFEIRQEWDAR